MAQRGGKKPSQFPSDFIPLGSKPGGSGGTKRDAAQAGVPGPSALGKAKPKVVRPSPPSSVNPSMPSIMSMPNLQSNLWENSAIECDTSELVRLIDDAENINATDRIEGYILGSVKSLKTQRAKPDPVLYLSLMYLSKSRDYLFQTKDILDAFCSLLRRDVKEAYKAKGNALVSVLAANVLMSALRNERTWPDLLVKVYIEDAIGERVWVDHPDCKGFVENICTAFDTKMPSSNLFFSQASKPPSDSASGPGRESPGPGSGQGGQGGGSRSGSGSATPTRPGTDDDSQGLVASLASGESLPINVINIGDPMSASTSPNPNMDNVQVLQRYEGYKASIEQMVLEVVKEQLNRRQGAADNITRNFIKFLTTACGLMEVRHLVIPKLEMWIMNHKISRPAQELLMAVAMNCNTHSQQDIEVIGGFTKFRFKNKPNVNLYLACIRELCSAHKENMPTLLKHTVFNELSNARNTNNMAILQVMFNIDKEVAPTSLALVFVDLLMMKECYLRALRALLREIVRFLRFDINLHIFCHNLMQLPRNKEVFVADFEFRERMFTSITDLITLAIFLGISPGVKEAMTAYLRGDDKKDLTPYKNFLKQTALIQRDAMVWMLECVIKVYKPEAGVFPQSLHKILFMVQSEEYWRVDGWPDEASRNLYIKATQEIPLLQDTLCHIFVIGISKQHPINGRDIIDLVDVLVKRAAGLHPLIADDFQVLGVDRVQQVMEILFQLAAYNYPDSITLPKDYQPPKMAIATAYWKAWQVLILLCAHNPTDFGKMAWEHYPTLRALMEMCITNQFQFPPPTLASGEQADEMRAKDIQTSTMEKQDILQFEIHLAAATNKATITESNSLLLTQLITNDPEGNFRRPPQAVLDQLAQANQHYKIGHLLCRSRSPDFLLAILGRQESNQAMPWLADLVESNEGSFNVLPVQCLCEFLLDSTNNLMESDEESSKDQKTKKRKQKQLLLHLQQLLQHPVAVTEQKQMIETLDYFMQRLSSQQTHQRLQALKGLKLVLSPIESEDAMEEDIQIVEPDVSNPCSEWLLNRLPRLPCFANYYGQISQRLRLACQVENDPVVVSMYLQFLAHYAPEAVSDLSDLCLDISSIIVERSTLLPAILPGTLSKTPMTKIAYDTYAALLRLFIHYMSRVRHRVDQPPMNHMIDNEGTELINVRWYSGPNAPNVAPQVQSVATVHFFIVHAQIILLTYGPQRDCLDLFNQLLAIWIPSRGEIPRAFMSQNPDIHNPQDPEVVLIPDWLKLKMIRSEVPSLVDAALVELDPQQLVLFIQSFGIPVPSMSKLLQKLDQAIQTNFDGVKEAVMDKQYMGQLVAVQHQRGAQGGHVFANLLGLDLSAHKQESRLQPPRPSDMTSSRPVIVIPPRSTAMIPPGYVKTTLLHLFDVGSPSRMTLKDKRDTFRTLQKYLTSEIGSNTPSRPMLEATVKALEAIVKDNNLRDAFVTSMLQHTCFSASLIRLITSALLRPKLEDLPAASILARVAEAVLNENVPAKKRPAKDSNNPVWKLLEDFLTKRGASSASSRSGSAKSNNSSLNKAKLDLTFEKSLKGQVEAAMKKKETKPLIEAMGQMLLTQDKKNHSGLIIDWLQKIDPELQAVPMSLRQKLLFNNNPHLLTVFSHLANWNQLKTTVDEILKVDTDQHEASSILDFVATCTFLKMQWQNNDKHKPKHDSGPQDVLQLRPGQVEKILDLALAEASKEPMEEKRLQILKSRVPLIVSCLDTTEKAQKAMEYLQGSATNNSKVDLMLQIYMKLPQSLTASSSNSAFGCGGGGQSGGNLGNGGGGGGGHLDGGGSSVSIYGNTSGVDTISHFLLLALASTQHGRNWTDQMREFEAAARKLAATHPLLLLRNLPLLAAGMKGRTDFDFSFFKSRNHFTFYTMALGLLELCVPRIFEAKFKKPLQDCLECYMSMLQAYYTRREFFKGLTENIVAFLHIYLNHAPKEACDFFAKHRSVLARYHKAARAQAPNSQALIELAKVINLDDTDNEDEISETLLISGASNYTQSEKSNVQENARKLGAQLQNAGNDEHEILEVLNSISKGSLPQPSLLTHFVQELSNLISHESKNVRNQAYDLFLKLLRHDPTISHQLMVPYLGCLETNDPAIAGHALDKLPDVAPLSQEHLATMMKTAFNLGLYSTLEVNHPICDTLTLLNSLSGY